MKEKILYAVWGCFYILCVGLGFIPDPVGLGKVLLVLISVLFFVPGFLLLQDAVQTKAPKQLLRLRLVCAASLILTFAALVTSFLTAPAGEKVGSLVHELLALVSAPMLCSQYWALSLFLWACLFMATIVKRPKNR